MTAANDSKRPCEDGKVCNKDGKCVMPEVTFTALIMSLNTAALLHLGEIVDPDSGAPHKDIVLAKHTIDTLTLLREKTRGNLMDEENNLLENVLYDLKMRYVKICA